MKKSLLLLSTITAASIPLAAVVSCSFGGHASSKDKKANHNGKDGGSSNGQNHAPVGGLTTGGNDVDTSQDWTSLTKSTVINPVVKVPWTAIGQQSKPTIVNPVMKVPWTTIGQQSKPAIVNPVVKVPWTVIGQQSKPAIVNPTTKVPWTTIGQQSKPKAVVTQPQVKQPTNTQPPYAQQPTNTVVPQAKQPATQVASIDTIDTSEKALTTFNITTINEDPKIDGFLPDVKHGLREFRQYDNGLFKIKIETSLIGQGCYYSDNSKADLEATSIAKSISIGPAITHFPKGIQILHSSHVASLGGPQGVQIAVSNKFGSANDDGIVNQASLVDHEYGHHETMYDFDDILGGTLFDDAKPGQESLRNVMARAFKNAGYESMAKLMVSSLVSKQGFLDFIPAEDKDFPSDYGPIKAGQHSVFGVPDYPFNAEEVATRALNILSCRVSWSAEDLYTQGKVGHYPLVNHSMQTFEPPAAFVSDATFRHFTGDSIFGGGKDNSRTDKLIQSYKDDVFGVNKGAIKIFGDPNNNGTISKIQLDDFGSVPDLATLEVQDDYGKVVAKSSVTAFNSRIGFKDELVSNTWNRTINEPIRQINNFTMDIENVRGGYYKVIGKDTNGNEVDISKLIIGEMSSADGLSRWRNRVGLIPEGNHFYVNLDQ